MKVAVKLFILALVLLVAMATFAVAGEKTQTVINGAIPNGDGTVGMLTFVLDGDNEAISQGVVVAKLFHRRGGKWVLIDKDRDRPDDDGAFEHLLEGVPSKGRCKLVAKFLGTKRYDPSKDVNHPHCTDQYWH
jgi:hypothetical protein